MSQEKPDDVHQSAYGVCTGLTAAWCPIHGHCACDRTASLDDPNCPLHRPESEHAELWARCPLYQAKGQCYCSVGLSGPCWADLATQARVIFGVGPEEMFRAPRS